LGNWFSDIFPGLISGSRRDSILSTELKLRPND
jgi:hypothetical protein